MTSTRLIAPTTNFGIQLLKAEVAANKGKNVLVSPASISIALAMTNNGARGQTQKDICKALALPDYGDGLTTTNASYANLLADLSDTKALGVKLSIANAIWASKGIAFRQDFLNANKAAFKAAVNSADFGEKATLDAINKWASDNTNGRIPKILEEIGADAIMYLLNAVYFKGDWTVKFDKARTKDGDFNTPAGKKTHPIMHRSGDMLYRQGESYQAVKLPFGDSKRINLYVYLPKTGLAVEDFVASFEDKWLTEQAQLTWESEGDLYLPRFQVEYDVELTDTLTALGMGDAFSGDTADFSGIADGSLYISEVKHKTFAKFDEDGGEAAAVTSVGIGLESVRIPFSMKVDRPFVVYLYDEGTGTVLFNGVINDPK